MKPTFTLEQVREMESQTMPATARDLHGKEYIPGFVGLNNIKNNDFINCVMQALSRVPVLREAFLVHSAKETGYSDLVKQFAELLRKMWNPRAFKGHVSPHEFIQARFQRSFVLFV